MVVRLGENPRSPSRPRVFPELLARLLTASAIHCSADGGDCFRHRPLIYLTNATRLDRTHERTHNAMLEPDQWDAVLSRINGTVYRDTERIPSNALLNALEFGPDPVCPSSEILRQEAS